MYLAAFPVEITVRGGGGELVLHVPRVGRRHPVQQDHQSRPGEALDK
jgi:hypothetical protein